jgi:four helix bundle protein
VFKFEKLTVWQRAVRFADLIYTETRGFPDDEKFALTNQIRRAAVSVSSNLAEGSARPDPDFARFVGYAAGSLYEVITQAKIAHNRRYLNDDALAAIYNEGEEISRMLSGLRDSLA